MHALNGAIITIAFSLGLAANANATTTSYSNEVAFQAALTDGFTVIDTSAHVGLTTADLSAIYDGATFTGQASYVRSDGLIPHGSFFDANTPHVGMNFDATVRGVGVTSNSGDGGAIMIYDGFDGTGNLLGTATFGSLSAALFGGITSTDVIRSVIFTCEYNADLACGLIDPTYGNAASAVPVPAAFWLFGSSLIGLLGMRRR